MAQDNIKIISVNPVDFQQEVYSAKDEALIPSVLIDTAFTSSTDVIYFEVFDFSRTKIFPPPPVPITSNAYKVVEDETILDPEKDLQEVGFTEGTYYISYNFYRQRLGSSPTRKYFIQEINSDRTELRLNATGIIPSVISGSTTEFIDYRDTSETFVDFNLSFVDGQTVIANNIQLDNQDDLNPTILIKLYEALPAELDVNSQCWVLETLSDPQAYEVTFPIIEFEEQDFEYIAGPNYNLAIKGQTGGNTQDISFSNLLDSNLTSSTQQVTNLLKRKEVNINIDYTDFNNFVHFSSAQTRLENFYYKVGLIESASNQINDQAITGATKNTVAFSASNAVLENSINEIIEKFDGYEYFLYFNSGSSFSYPKSNTSPPYTLYSTGSDEVLNWLGSAYPSSSLYGGLALSASNYDEDNKDYLYNTIPEYLTSDSNNARYFLFVDMVGQHYDNVWEYSKNISNKFNSDNRLDFGIAKDMVADAIRDFGVKLYQNNFNTDDLYLAFLGLTPSGSSFPVNNITGSIDSTLGVPTGSEFVNTRISASNDIVPLDDVNKSIYKRIYHNIPYLLKTKGTVAGMRALITSYGIPDTILRISEFGGQDRINEEDFDFAQNQFNYALKANTATFSSSFAMNGNWGSSDNIPNSIQFRFKTDGIPSASAAYSQSIFYKNGTAGAKTVGMSLEYDSTLLTSGSHSGSVASPSASYGTLSFYPNAVANASNRAELTLPFFDGNWWSVMINPNLTSSKFTLFAANEMFGEIGFSGSNTISADATEYKVRDEIFWLPIEDISLANKTLTPLSGAFQELRYYNQMVSQSSFDDFTLNPYSFIGNQFNTTPEQLMFRVPFGTDLNISGSGPVSNPISIHPKVTGSYTSYITGSFKIGHSTGSFGNSAPIYIPNTQKIYYDQLAAGIKSRSTEKVRLSTNIIPEGDTLSPIESIAQSSFTTESYTANPDYLEVAFSPQNQIDNDIINQLGNFNLGNYIGDPRQISQSLYETTYPDLVTLSEEYFRKYISSYDLIDFIRLIKFFDNSLFKMLEDFTPANVSLSSGVVIKQHILERNKYRVPQVSSSFEDYSGSIKPQARGYNTGSSDYPQYAISGSSIYVYSGGPAGFFSPFNSDKFSPSGSLGLGPDNRFGITQSWSEISLNRTGSTPYARDDQREFYNGEFSGSNIPVDLKPICRAYFGIDAPEDFFYFVQFFSEDGTVGNALPLNQFLQTSTVPNPGNAWLWNDGNKVKYIKISLTAANGNTLNDFLQENEYITFILGGASDAQGNLLPDGPQTYYIDDVAITTNNAFGNFALLTIFQPPSSVAVQSYNTFASNPAFSASGDFIWFGSSDPDNDLAFQPAINETASIPQGSVGGGAAAPKEQFFRGWFNANYYNQSGVLITSNGHTNGSLQQFNTGSAEVDRDISFTYNLSTGDVALGLNNTIPIAYKHSQVPWFMNASASYKYIPSESFAEFSTLNSDTGSLPQNLQPLVRLFSGSGDSLFGDNNTDIDTAIQYFYVESENKIYVSGSEFQNNFKNPNLAPEFINAYLNQELVGLNSPQPQIFLAPDFFIPGSSQLLIPLSASNKLSVYRGYDPGFGTQYAARNGNMWKYNRYMHRPYKIYIVTTTGSESENSYPEFPYSPIEFDSSGDPQYMSLSNPQLNATFAQSLFSDGFRATLLGVIGNESTGSVSTSNPSANVPSMAPFSGSFTIFSQTSSIVPNQSGFGSVGVDYLKSGGPGAYPWIITKYSKLVNPPASGSAISISKSDGTPVFELTASINASGGPQGGVSGPIITFQGGGLQGPGGPGGVSNPTLAENIQFLSGSPDGTPGGTLLPTDPYSIGLPPGTYIYTSSEFDGTPNPGAKGGYTAFGLTTRFDDYVTFEIQTGSTEIEEDVKIDFINPGGVDASLQFGGATQFGLIGALFPSISASGNNVPITASIGDYSISGDRPRGIFATKVEGVYIEYSSSLTSSDAGSYTFNNIPNDPVNITSSIFISSLSGSIFDSSLYGTAKYGVNVYGDGSVGTGGGPTYPTASVNIYLRTGSQVYPGTKVGSATYFSQDGGNAPGSQFGAGARLVASHSFDPDDPTGNGNPIAVGDQLFMSFDVDLGDYTKFILSSSLIVPEYTMSISGSNPFPAGPVPTIFQELSDFSRAFDCQPLLNNYVNDRLNSVVMDVDYSTNILVPVNYTQIINFSASRASVPDSNYTQYTFRGIRYLGSKINATRVNFYTPGDTLGYGGGLGQVPSINHNNAFLGYFTNIIDLYPLVNGKTAYYVKYLIDSKGDLFDPALTDGSYYNLIGTFKEVDNFLPSDDANLQTTPTFASAIVRSPESEIGEIAEELTDLANLAPVFKSGEYPIPVIYSQTSSIGYSTTIPLTGSGIIQQDATERYSDYAFTANSEVEASTVNLPSQGGTKYLSSSKYIPVAGFLYDNNYDSGTNFGGSGNPGSSYSNPPVFINPVIKSGQGQFATSSYEPSTSGIQPTGSIFFLGKNPTGTGDSMFDHNTPGFPSNPSALAQGQPLSDDYTIEMEYTFYTTGMPNRYQDSGKTQVQTQNVGHFQAVLLKATSPTGFNTFDRQPIKVDSVELNIQKNIQFDLGNAQYKPVGALSSPNAQSWVNPATSGPKRHVFNLNFHGGYLRDAIQTQESYPRADWISNPRNNSNSSEAGNRRYQWTVKLSSNGTLQSGFWYRWNMGGFARHFTGPARTNDHWTEDGKWDRGFFPPVPNNSTSTLSQQKLRVYGLKTATAQEFNLAKSDYFFLSGSGRVQNSSGYTPPVAETSNGNSILLMSSSILNNAYDSGYKAGDLNYVGEANPIFPLNKEPDFITFPPVKSTFNIKLGDEIRFQNNEDLAFTVIGPNPGADNIIQTFEPVLTGSNAVDLRNMLRIEVNGEIPSSTDVNFFVIRRYKDSKNFVILDQQKSYGIQRLVSQSYVESDNSYVNTSITKVIKATSPGILRPQFVVDGLAVQPDEIFDNLTNKQILD